MNIFYLDEDIELNAQYHCDKHLCKMQLELAQMLSTAYHIVSRNFNKNKIYKPTHENHPYSKWVRSGKKQFVNTLNLLEASHKEYQYRFNKPDSYQKIQEIIEYIKHNIPKQLPDAPWTNPPQIIPDQYKQEDTVEAYRSYYTNEIYNFASWT